MEFRMSEAFQQGKITEITEPVEEPKPPQITLYAVRNSDGKWFRARGYGGYGDSWVDDFTSIQVRLYPKVGTARAQVSFFAKNYPQFPVPEIVEFTLTGLKVLNEEKRVSKVAQQREVREASAEKKRRERELQNAEAEFNRARVKLEQLAKRLLNEGIRS